MTDVATSVPDSIGLNFNDLELWDQAIAAFRRIHPRKTIGHTQLSSALGGVNRVRHLINLGLIERDGAGEIRKTGVLVAEKRAPTVIGDISGHTGFDITKMGKKTSPTSSKVESKPRFRLSELKKSDVAVAIEALNDRERLVIRDALSTVDWNRTDNYRIRIREAKAKIWSHGYPACSKPHIIHALNRIGFRYELTESALLVPSWFRELTL